MTFKCVCSIEALAEVGGERTNVGQTASIQSA